MLRHSYEGLAYHLLGCYIDGQVFPWIAIVLYKYLRLLVCEFYAENFLMEMSDDVHLLLKIELFVLAREAVRCKRHERLFYETYFRPGCYEAQHQVVVGC